jgi:hypothetical protein
MNTGVNLHLNATGYNVADGDAGAVGICGVVAMRHSRRLPVILSQATQAGKPCGSLCRNDMLGSSQQDL